MAPSTSRLLYATNHSATLLCVRALLFPTSVSSFCLQRQLLITILVLPPWFLGHLSLTAAKCLLAGSIGIQQMVF